MLETLIYYQLYIIIGILVFLVFAFIIYFTKSLIDRARFVKTLNNMRKPLMERINSIDVIYEVKEKKEEINMIINQIKNDIDLLKQDIYVSQDVFQLEKIEQIDKEISMFYEKMQAKQSGEEIPTPQYQTVQPQQITEVVYQQAVQQIQQPQESQVATATPKIMNENFSKFLVVYREKDKVIEERNKMINEKNKSLYILQQKLTESETRLKQFIIEDKNNKNKDKIIEEKIHLINILQLRLQEVENKFKKVALLHKSITEKEQIIDQIIDEKNKFITSLQSKLSEIETKLHNMMTINENTKEKMLDRKLSDIDRQIKEEKRTNWIFIIMFILFLLVYSDSFS